MADYLRDESGKQFLRTVSKSNNCIILTDSPDSPEWLEAKRVINKFCLFVYIHGSLSLNDNSQLFCINNYSLMMI